MAEQGKEGSTPPVEPVPPTRDSALDGLKPRDFDPHWPNGGLVIPDKLVAKGFTSEQCKSIVKGVEVVRQLAKDITEYVSGANTTQEALAKRCAINPAAITRFKRGHAFPQLGTYAVLRGAVPTQAEMRKNRFRTRDSDPS